MLNAHSSWDRKVNTQYHKAINRGFTDHCLDLFYFVFCLVLVVPRRLKTQNYNITGRLIKDSSTVEQKVSQHQGR